MCERTNVELPMSSSLHLQNDIESIQEDVDKEEPSSCRKVYDWCVDFYFTNEFLVLVVLAIVLAKAYPPLGAEYLRPEITATWIAVIFIFCTYSTVLLYTNELHMLRCALHDFALTHSFVMCFVCSHGWIGIENG
jgi:hypothetical protein